MQKGQCCCTSSLVNEWITNCSIWFFIEWFLE